MADVVPVTDAKVLSELPVVCAIAPWHFVELVKVEDITAPFDVQMRLAVMGSPPPPPPPALGTTLPSPGRPPAPAGTWKPGHGVSTEGSTLRVAVDRSAATWNLESG